MIKKVTKSAQIRSYVAANPKAKPQEVADAIGVGLQYVYTVLWNAKKKAKVAKKATLTLRELMDTPKAKEAMEKHKQIMDKTISDWKSGGVYSSEIPMFEGTSNRLVELSIRPKIRMQSSQDAQIEMFDNTPDPVDHPAHYKVGGIETIDFIEAKKLNYNIGNVIKYLTRADYKGNKLEDLRKAQWYLTREISTLK
jgi:hypothetical protein